MYSQFDLHRLSTEHLATAKPLFIFCRCLFQIHTLQVHTIPHTPHIPPYCHTSPASDMYYKKVLCAHNGKYNAVCCGSEVTF